MKKRGGIKAGMSQMTLFILIAIALVAAAFIFMVYRNIFSAIMPK